MEQADHKCHHGNRRPRGTDIRQRQRIKRQPCARKERITDRGDHTLHRDNAADPNPHLRMRVAKAVHQAHQYQHDGNGIQGVEHGHREHEDHVESHVGEHARKRSEHKGEHRKGTAHDLLGGLRSPFNHIRLAEVTRAAADKANAHVHAGKEEDGEDHDRAGKPKVHGGRSGKDGSAVGSVGHHGAELHTGKAQAAVDDGHEHAGDHTGTRNLEGHALVIGNTQLVDGLGDDDAEGERREQVHGLIASQKALHGGACIVRSLRRVPAARSRQHPRPAR